MNTPPSFPPPPSLEEAPAPAPGMGLWARLANTISAPGDVYADIRERNPSWANILAPLALNILTLMIFFVGALGQDAIRQNFNEQQQRQLAKQVAAGKMTEAQAQQVSTMFEKISPMVFVVPGAILGMTAMTFLGALIVWPIGSAALAGGFGYVRALEAVSLSSVVLAIQNVLLLFLASVRGSISVSFGPALFLPLERVGTPLFTSLSFLNVFSIWSVVILAFGLAKLGNGNRWLALACCFGVYAVLAGAATALTQLG